MARSCSVENTQCEVGAQFATAADRSKLVRCHVCGEDVCRMCSEMRYRNTWTSAGAMRRRQVRVCDNCHEDRLARAGN